jgi:hypothetical protein
MSGAIAFSAGTGKRLPSREAHKRRDGAGHSLSVADFNALKRE